jgi:hypothetical protein
VPLGTAAHIDYALRSAGDVVTFGAQSGYGLLDSPDLDVSDHTEFRFRGYARTLVVREGQFTGLAEDQTINFAGVPFLIRDVGSAGANGLRRLAVTRATPIDHLAVTPNPYFVTVGQVATLVPTAYDIANNVLTGRAFSWSSSNPTAVSIDSATGQLTAHTLGSAIITVTAEGKTTTVGVTVALDLTYTLDWNPLDKTQLALPRVFVPEGGAGDTTRHRPRYYHTSELFARGAYRRNAAAFDMGAEVSHTLGGPSTIIGPFFNNFFINHTYDIAAGPPKGYAQGTAHRIWPAVAYSVNPTHAYANVGKMVIYRNAEDQQDIHDAKISWVAACRIENAGDIGKQLWLEVWTQDVNGDPVTLRSRTPVTFTDTNWVYRTISNTQASDEGETCFLYALPDDDTLRASSNLVAYPGNTADRRASGSVDQDIAAGFFHDTLGALFEHETLQGWVNSDDPTLSAGSKVNSSRPVPDAQSWWSSATELQKLITLPAGAYLTAPRAGLQGSVNVATNVLSDVVVRIKRVQVALYVSPNDVGWMPANGDLVADLFPQSSGEVIASVPLTRIPLDTIASFRFSDGGAVYAAQLYVNQAGQSELHFTPRIRNATGASITMYATRCSMYNYLGDEERNRGLPRSWMKQTRTAEVFDDGSFIRLWNAQDFISSDQGFTAFRFIPFWNLGDFYTLGKINDAGNPVGIELLQTGAEGGNDHNFGISITNDASGKVAIRIGMDRGSGGPGPAPPANPRSFGATVLVDPTDTQHFRVGQVCDIVIGWQNWAVHSLGLGFGGGYGLTWYANGDLFSGSAVSMTSSGTDAWSMLGLYCPGSDRDLTRQAFVGIQRWAAGLLADPATFKNSASYAVQQLWGARPSYS